MVTVMAVKVSCIIFLLQTATSYVMKIRLGGKGYAPDPNHPLGPHVKGIGEFVSLMHRMETVIEEDPDIRLVNFSVNWYNARFASLSLEFYNFQL